jgi:hypothetical protein
MEWQIFLTIIGTVTGAFSLWYRINADINNKIDKLKTQCAKELEIAKEQGDAKRARIWERVDEIKNAHRSEIDTFRKDIAENYVPLKMCGLIHTNTDKTLTELKIIVTSIERKVDELTKKVYEDNKE